MCYSVMIKKSVDAYGAKLKIANRKQIKDEMLDLQVYPHGHFPIVKKTPAGRFAEMSRYSLIPRWSKVEKPKFATYNARVETISEKPTWAKPLTENRCLVAFSGFFESCYGGTHDGHIVRFEKSDSSDLMVAAGLHEDWMQPETGEVISSFAIVTSKPSAFIEATGHDRSPVFLGEQDWEHWLSDEQKSAGQWHSFLLERQTVLDLQATAVRPLKKKKSNPKES